MIERTAPCRRAMRRNMSHHEGHMNHRLLFVAATACDIPAAVTRGRARAATSEPGDMPRHPRRRRRESVHTRVTHRAPDHRHRAGPLAAACLEAAASREGEGRTLLLQADGQGPNECDGRATLPAQSASRCRTIDTGANWPAA